MHNPTSGESDGKSKQIKPNRQIKQQKRYNKKDIFKEY